MTSIRDVVVIGSGPNGLTAAVLLARQGLEVLVLEADEHLGGGARTRELTLPGFLHDPCSAVHTMGCLSPVFRRLELDRWGLEWLHPEASVAHPLDREPGVRLWRSVEETAEQLGRDAVRYERWLRPFLAHSDELFDDVLSPLSWPRQPLTQLRLGWFGLRSARRLAYGLFEEQSTRALLAGCAAHSTLPLTWATTGAVGLVFLLAAHVKTWPVARGGSGAISDALVKQAVHYGARCETERRITDYAQLPPARAYLFDIAPKQVAELAEGRLPSGYRRRLAKYRMGPGVFKLDYALGEPIPWNDPDHLRASTAHVGGRFDEVAAAEAQVWRGEHPERPFVMVAQQSLLDPGRAPHGNHTGYAYCHVPAHSDVDMTEAVERQIERFAPGFRDVVLARHKTFPRDFQSRNPSSIGGAITGGVADLGQLFARPVARLNPYATPNPKMFLCSHSTPPGGGVHGMCGFHAARTVLRRVFGKRLALGP